MNKITAVFEFAAVLCFLGNFIYGKDLKKLFKKLIPAVCAISLLTASVAFADVRVYVNGKRVNQETIIHKDYTYVPLRAISEALGAMVNYDADTKSAYITFSEDDAVAKIVSDVSPSVVTIVGNYSGNDITQYSNATVHGTGVIYKGNGYIVTNAHVVDNIKNLTVILYDGTSLPGEVLFSDEKADLAVVKIDKVGLKPVVMAEKSDIVSGKTAIAIGTPISLSMRNTVTKGIVCASDVALPDSYYKLIQTDTTINPGNSGGPLLNTKGQLIGINSSKYSGVGIDNMAFSIPVDTVKYVIEHFEKYQKVQRADFKITLEQSWEAKIGLPTKKGITVKSSENAALSAGDVITAVNSVEVHSIADWNEALKSTYNGESATVTVTRNGQTMEINVE